MAIGPAADYPRNPNYCRSPHDTTHTGLGALDGYNMVRKDANPQFAAAFDKADDGAPRRLDLAAGHPRRLQRLQAIIAKGERNAAQFLALHAPAMLLAKFRSFWH